MPGLIASDDLGKSINNRGHKRSQEDQLKLLPCGLRGNT